VVRIPVFVYICHAPGKEIRVPTFKESRANGGRVMGTIVAPEGSSLYKPQAIAESPKLKIPKTTRDGEFWLLDVGETISSARAGHFGLTWESARAEALAR
jgi:hypothetical protein